MAIALHIIDRHTPWDSLDTLRLLAPPQVAVASVGPPRTYRRFDLPVEPTHEPLGSAWLCGWRMRGRAGAVELLHAWSPAALRAAITIHRLRGRPVLYSLPSAPRGAERRWLLRAMRAYGLHVTVPTRASREAMLSAGADDRAVHVLPPPAAPADRDDDRRTVREALGVGDGEVLMAAPAEMTRWAGHKFAAWGHAIVRQILQNVRVIFPGGGPAERYVRFFAGTTGYCPREVHFTGERFSRRAVLAAADIVTFYRERDGGLTALLEAMSAGCAVAASCTPDQAELLVHEQTALLAAPSDARSASAAILRLTEDAELRRRLGRSAAEAADAFSVRGASQALDAIYQRVLAAGGRA